MPKAKRPDSKARKKGSFVIGRDNFGKISAVEGIRLTPTMKKRAAGDCPPRSIAGPSSDLIVRLERAGHG
jgi:hypothetical protein